MLSDYGNLHVILSETNEKEGPNPSYEVGNLIVKNALFTLCRLYFSCLVIGDRFRTKSEFRRKKSISEGYDFVNQSKFSYSIRGKRASIFMQISVSVGE